MSGVGSSRTDAVAVAWSFPAGTSWGAPGTEPPSMAKYLSLETLPIGDHKLSCTAELRRALTDSAEPPFALPPAAAEELRRIRRGVTESSARAKERAKALHGSIQKLYNYRNVVVRRRQRTHLAFHLERPMNILGTKPADPRELLGRPLAEFVPTGSTKQQQQEGMSGVGSSRPDAIAWSFPAGTSWGGATHGAAVHGAVPLTQDAPHWQLQALVCRGAVAGAHGLGGAAVGAPACGC